MVQFFFSVFIQSWYTNKIKNGLTVNTLQNNWFKNIFKKKDYWMDTVVFIGISDNCRDNYLYIITLFNKILLLVIYNKTEKTPFLQQTISQCIFCKKVNTLPKSPFLVPFRFSISTVPPHLFVCGWVQSRNDFRDVDDRLIPIYFSDNRQYLKFHWVKLLWNISEFCKVGRVFKMINTVWIPNFLCWF